MHSFSSYLCERWSSRYKRSIDCSAPRGFSQRAHCQGKAKAVGEARDYRAEYLKMYGGDNPTPKQRKAMKKKTARKRVLRRMGREGVSTDGREIDHKNGNALDSRPSNLRLVSRHTNRSKDNNKWRRNVSESREWVLWGLPKGETDPIHERILYTQARSEADVKRVQALAARDGWHSFRVQVLDLSKPFNAGAAFAAGVKPPKGRRAKR